MSAEDNIKAIQAMYEAFGRGDVAAILEGVTDDVDWSTDTSSTVAPWYGVRAGKAQVPSFFEAFGSTMELDQFEPQDFAASGDSVFVLVHIHGKARATGKTIDMNLHHYFRFRDGKVSYYRGTEDVPQVAAALS